MPAPIRFLHAFSVRLQAAAPDYHLDGATIEPAHTTKLPVNAEESAHIRNVLSVTFA